MKRVSVTGAPALKVTHMFFKFLTCFFLFVAVALGLNEEIYPLFYSSDCGNYQKVSQLKIKTSKFLWGTFDRKMFLFLFPCT